MSQIEHTILSGLLNDPDFCKKTLPFLQEEYFLDRVDRAVFQSIKTFVDQYGGTPTKEALLISLEADKNLAEEEFRRCKEVIVACSRTQDQDLRWLVDTTEKFCQDKAIYNAIFDSIKIIDGKDKNRTPMALPEILAKALAVSFDTDVGHDFLEDFEDRFEFYHHVEKKIPFDLEMMNTITNGGICSKTLNVILAGTGCGKSAFLCHHASACLMQNKNVLYITLEMAEERIAERIDANIMDISMEDMQDMSMEMYGKRLKSCTRGVCGKLIVKEYPTSSANANHFRILLDELKSKKNFVPDIVFIDYINICSSSRFKSDGISNSYGYIKAIAEELRGLAMERDVSIFTATQANRSGYANTDIDLTNTAESFGTPATADFMIALITTDELEKAGQIMVKQLKNRYNTKSTNKKFILGLNYSKMKFSDVKHSEFEELTDSKTETTETSGFGSGFGKGKGKGDTSDWNI